MVPDKKLAPGELRFLARKIDAAWRVYDKVRGSFPYHNKELGGKVLQDVSQKEAQVEADRLNELFVKKAKSPEEKRAKGSAKKKPTPSTPEVTGVLVEETIEEPEAEWVEAEDLPDYGVMDEETAKKYLEGIL